MRHNDETLALIDELRKRGVREFESGDGFRVVLFREEVASAPDHQTTNDDSRSGARPRRHPGGRLVSAPISDDK